MTVETSPSAKSEAAEEDLAPVEKGQIRLHGHFCGVATTASHRLELAIPIKEEVDINLLYPLLAGLEASFQKRAEKATGDESPSSKKDLWAGLKDLLEVDRTSPQEEEVEVVEDLLQSLGPNWQESFERAVSRQSSHGVESSSRMLPLSSRSCGEDELKAALRDEERQLRATKAQERAMEIDFEAKEALVQNLMEERKALRAKTQELTKQLEQGVAERWFCGCLQGVSALFHRSHDEGSVLDTIVETLEERAAGESAEDKEERIRALQDDQILLDGHFAGRMVTKAHCLEIAMPVGATLPSSPVLELLRAVRDANGAHEVESFQQRAEVVKSLLAVVEADMDPALCQTDGDEERSDPTITPPEPATEAATEAAPKAYEDMSKELEILRSESSRMQQEAEQLRLKNAALVNFLSSAERSAARLRAALTDAGIQPVLSSPETSPKTAAQRSEASHPDLHADIKELETWATRLRGIR